MIDFFRKYSLFVIAGVVLLAFLFLSVLVLLPNQTTQPSTIFPTPTPVAVSVSDEPLTQQEASFPPATPQPFRNPDTTETGTLVVTSSPDGATVLLDAIGIHPEEGDPIPPGEKWPENTTPFSVRNIPAGTHYLVAIKPGEPYDMTEYEYEIRPGETTRVHIILKPLRTGN